MASLSLASLKWLKRDRRRLDRYAIIQIQRTILATGDKQSETTIPQTEITAN